MVDYQIKLIFGFYFLPSLAVEPYKTLHGVFGNCTLLYEVSQSCPLAKIRGSSNCSSPTECAISVENENQGKSIK